ncbi:MAG: exo-beta-N-acetylmuramidase NamZ family protein [Mycobacteriales bacterium]
MRREPVNGSPPDAAPLRTGLDRMLQEPPSGRLGLLTNVAAVTADLRLGADALLGAGADLVALFGPEHGFRGTAQAGESDPSTVDSATGIRVFDTYGAESGVAGMLAESGIDTMLVDLQNVGARFYTYESSLYDVIAATVGGGPQVTVLDRPNPIGGERIAGPVLDPAFASFVGRAPIPIRHGLTMGELARLFADLLGAPPVDVVELTGWRRGDLFADIGRPWVPPSPNIPTVETTLVYPGSCLLEGCNLAPGRGTTTPFQLAGAPWADDRLVTTMRDAAMPGLLVRDARWMPTFSDYAGQQVTGIAAHVTDADIFDPLLYGVTLLCTAHACWPADFRFRDSHFDRLAGSSRLRTAIEAGTEPAEIVAGWADDEAAFARARAAYLLYD